MRQRIIVLLLAAVCFGVRGQTGHPDPSFYADANGEVFAIVTQSDGRIVIGGNFSGVNGVQRNGVARLFDDGRTDSGFDVGVGAGGVLSLALQADQKILVGGIFSSFNGTGGGGLVRLNVNGSLDTNFSAGPFRNVYAVAYHPGGSIYVAGERFIWRLYLDGTRDTNFSITLSERGFGTLPSFVADLIIQPDEKVLFAGSFYQVNGHDRYGSARLNTNGSLDDSFVPSANGMFMEVDGLALRGDGKVFQAGGALTLLDATGDLDTNFSPAGYSFEIFDAASAQIDGKVLVGGNVHDIGGSRDFFARFDTNGTVDETFSGFVDAEVEAIRVLSDGRILIGGAFSAVDGESHFGIARLLGDSPILKAGHGIGGQCVLSWPAAYTNFVLQSNSAVADSNWANVPVQPSTISNICYVTNNPISGSQFFRLSKQ